MSDRISSRKRTAEEAELAEGSRADTETESEDEAERLPDALIPAGALRVEGGADAHFEAGIILRVYVENFMCHRKFHVQLGRKMNFITGQNGSGTDRMCYMYG